MLKRTVSLFIALIIALSVCSISFFAVSAEEVESTATTDQATVDEATIVISDEPKVPTYSVNGTVIGYIGDANVDEKINVKDATAIQKSIAKLIYLPLRSVKLADTDNNGKVNVRDATAIQKYIAGFEVETLVWHLMYETGTHIHDYLEEAVEPKCETAGYTSYSCICGDEYKENEVSAIGHDYKIKVTMPTCVDKGYTLHTCKNCNKSYKDTETAATGKHSYDSNYKCKDCGVKRAAEAFATLKDFIKKNGEYDSETLSYLYPFSVVYEGDIAYLVYTAEDDAIGLVYILNEDEYTDIFSLAIVEGQSECGFFLLCQDYFQSVGSFEMSKFTANTKSIKDMEIYYQVDMDEADAVSYTIDFINAVLITYEDNDEYHNLPVSIQELGFTSYK